MKKLLIPFFISFLVAFIASNSYAGGIKLDNNNWNPEVKRKLENLLTVNSNKNKKVIFDFDNTVVSRDIGEATFALMVKKGLIKKENVRSFSPSFSVGSENVSVDSTIDLTEYYEKFIISTRHHENDDSQAVNSYVWLTQALNGLTPFDVISNTREVFNKNQSINDRNKGIQTDITVTQSKTSYLVPFFHPETVDLIGNLISNGYDVYIVTASPVWIVRYMAVIELNKLLQEKFGKKIKISPEKVLGVSTLIKDKRTGLLYKDPYLVREKTPMALLYSNLNVDELKNYEITNQPVYPITAFDGKTTNIMKFIVNENEKPFLAAGDSSGDFSMLRFSENKLWFARLEKEDYQEKVTRLVKKSEIKNWFFQPVLYKKYPGFVKNQKQLKTLFNNDSEVLKKYIKSVEIFQNKNFLENF